MVTEQSRAGPETAETLTSLGTVNVRLVATGQHGAHCYRDRVNSSSAQSTVHSPQPLKNFVTASSQHGTTNLLSQRQNHSSTSVLSAMDSSDGQRQVDQNGAVSVQVPHQRAQQSSATETLPHASDTASHYQQLVVLAPTAFDRSASQAQIQASYQPQILQGMQTISNDMVDQYRDCNGNTIANIMDLAPTGGSNSTQPEQSLAIDFATVLDSSLQDQRKAEATRKAKEGEEAKTMTDGVEKRKQASDLTYRAGKETHKEKPRRKSPTAETETFRMSGLADSCTEIVSTGPDVDETEVEIRALMAKFHELSERHPALPSKMWEEKQQSHIERTGARKSQSPQHPLPKSSKAAKLSQAGSEPVSRLSPVTNSTQTTARMPIPTTPPVQLPSTPATARTSLIPSTSSATRSAKHPPAIPGQKRQNNGTRKPTNSIRSDERKEEVAVAAAQWLNARPGNRTTHISPFDVVNMLHSNPSYVRLCEMIEKHGLKVERTGLAKALRQSVRKASSIPADFTSSTDPPNQALPPSQAQRRNDTRQDHMMPIAKLQASYVDNSQQQPLPIKHVTVMQSHANGLKHYINDNGQQRVHALKPLHKPRQDYEHTQPSPGSAREHCDHQIQPPSKLPSVSSRAQTVQQAGEPSGLPLDEKKPFLPPASKQDAASKRSFADIVDLTIFPDDDTSPHPPPKRLRIGRQCLDRLRSPGPPQYYPHASSSSTPTPPYYPDPHIAMPFNDLNQVPQPRLLSTMRGFASRAAVDERLKQEKLAKPIKRSKAIRQSAYDPRTIARDVRLATGRHPDMAHLNTYLEILKSSFRGQITGLSAMRWDLTDPGETTPFVQFGENDRDSVLDDADDEEEESRPVDQTFRIAIADDGTVATAYTEWRRRTLTSHKNSIKPKPSSTTSRPRPKAARTRPFTFTLRSTTSTPNAYPINHPSSPVAPPPSAAVATSTPASPQPFVQRTPYTEYRAAVATADTAPPHKKVRPVGLRKRPNADGGSSRAKPPHEPKYPVFLCGWLGCGARLHNLETLRRHVWKVHGRQSEDELWRCQWEGCGQDKQSVDQEIEELRVTRWPFGFETLQKLREHVENVHVSPIAWKLGDGPAGGLYDAHDSEMSEAYLSDARGKRVTPKISVPAEASQAGSNVPMLVSRGSGRPVSKTAQEKAKESEEAAIRRKKELGAGVDKGGARLVNAKRRQGFRDDEEFEMVVDDDED